MAEPIRLQLQVFRLSEEGAKVSEYIRNQIREAREEKGLSQRELSSKIKRSSAFVSQVESGRLALSVIELIAIAIELDKPMGYFLPRRFRLEEEGLSDKEWQLVRQFRRIETGEAQEVAIKQVRQLAEMKLKGKK